METKELEHLVEAMAGLLHAVAGLQAAQDLTTQSLLIATSQRDPSLVGDVQKHLTALAALRRSELEPEQERPFDTYIENMSQKLNLLSGDRSTPK